MVGSRHPKRYRLVQQVVTDPRHDALVVRVRLQSLDGGHYRLFTLYDPALGNDGADDRGTSGRHVLSASDGRVSTTLRSRPSFSRTASGLVGTSSDPWRDLRKYAGSVNKALRALTKL